MTVGTDAGAQVTWILLTCSSVSVSHGSGILGLLITDKERRLGAEVTPAAMVMGRGGLGPVFSLISGEESVLGLDLLKVDTPESLELRVEEGNSELVSRIPGQI